MLGRVVANFRIVSFLGRGGMGEVWKAEQVTLGDRPVALKLLAPGIANIDRAIERLRREGDVGASVRHSGIAEVYEAGESGGEHFVAMEFIDGESLTARIARGPLEPAEAVRVVAAVTDALAHAHERGVLHRDITPNNIMIETSGRVVLVDFGLALAEGRARITSTGVLVGTPQYLAPEVLRNFDPDHRSDLYSLGVVFYEALTGTPPFRAARPDGVLYSVLNETVEPPSRRHAGVPSELDDIVLRAMAREPVSRYQSAREMAEALTAGAGGGRRRSAAAPSEPGSGSGRTLAVLPFMALGAGDEPALLARGLSEALGSALGRFPALHVVPAMSTAGLGIDAANRVWREFGAPFVLGGTIQISAGRMRVTWSLVAADRGEQIRGDLLEGTTDELFQLQDRLVRDVAGALGVGASSPAGPLQPADPIAHERFLQALGYLQRFDSEASVDGAIKILEALTAGPGANAEMWGALGRAYRQKYRHSSELAWLERTVVAARHALSLDPDSAEALATLAYANQLLGRPEEAEQGFQRALAKRPDHTQSILGLVDLYRTQGRLEEAEIECRRAIAIRPTFWGSYNALGAVHFQAGRYSEAIEAWEQVVRMTPDNSRGYYNIGAAYFRMARFDDARHAYQHALDLYPTAAAYAGLGAVGFFQGDLVGAREAFERAVAMRPLDPVMWGNLGDAWRWLPDGDQRAAEAFANAIRLARDQLATNPKDADLTSNLAGWLSRTGAHEDAISAIRRAQELDPRGAQAAARAVSVYELAGLREEALAEVDRAVQLGCGWRELDLDPDLVLLRNTEHYRSRHPEWGALTASPESTAGLNELEGER